MKSRKDFFQIINSFPHTLAVYLTFGLDKEVIQKIAENSYSNIIILHDYRQGVSLSNNWDHRIVCIPINAANPHLQNCFHSKLYLLKGEDKAKLIVGSANLSKDSFTIEKELCCEIDLDFASELYQSIVNYIQQLIPQTHTSTEILSNAVKKLTYPTKRVQKSSSLNFICNTQELSIRNNVCKYLQEASPILKIASPFLSADFGDELLNFISAVKPKEIQFFLRNNYPLPKSLKSVNTKINFGN